MKQTSLLSKITDDISEEALENVFHVAVASVEFGSTIVSLRMTLDDLIGLTSGIKVSNQLKLRIP